MRKPTIVATAGIVVVLMASLAYAVEHTKEQLPDIRENLDMKKAVLLDVRTEREWKAGHLESARWFPLSSIQEGVKRQDIKTKIGKDRIIYLHCRSGGRALVAAELLCELGYDARAIKPGLSELVQGGFKPAKSASDKP